MDVKNKKNRVYKLIVTSLILTAAAISLSSCSDSISVPQYGKHTQFDSKIDKLINVDLRSSNSAKMPIIVKAHVGADIIVTLISAEDGVLSIDGAQDSVEVTTNVMTSVGVELGLHESWNISFTPKNGNKIIIVKAIATTIIK